MGQHVFSKCLYIYLIVRHRPLFSVLAQQDEVGCV